MRVDVTAVALWVATGLLPGVRAGGGGRLAEALGLDASAAVDRVLDPVLTFLVLGAVLALVHALVKPALKLLTLPLYLLTLGLFGLVVNALLLLLAQWLAGSTPLTFEIDGFWWALAAGAVVTVVSGLLDALLPSRD